MHNSSRFVLVLVGLAGCADDANHDDVVAAQLDFDNRGVSSPIRVSVPPGTRSVTVVVQGDNDALYALGEFTTSDGVDHVGWPQGRGVGEILTEQYFTEQVGRPPGNLHQSIRLGTFVHVHPNTPSLSLPSGDLTVSIVTSVPDAAAEVRIVTAPEQVAAPAVLHVNVFAVSNQFSISAEDPLSLAFLTATNEIFAPAKLRVVVEEATTLA